APNYCESFEGCGQSPRQPARCRSGVASPTLRPDAPAWMADQADGADAESSPGPPGKWPRPALPWSQRGGPGSAADGHRHQRLVVRLQPVGPRGGEVDPYLRY